MATKTKKAKKKAKPKQAERPQKKTRGLNAAEYVRSVAQKSRSGGCKVCCYPSVSVKLEEISRQMDEQRVHISAAQLLRDLKRAYPKFSCSDERFRKHMRECMGRDL